MSVSAFGVTAATVRSNRFPHLSGSFGTDTAPSAATVANFINQRAAYLEGKLLLEAIVASSISDSASAAYLWCQETLELMVAIRIAEVATGSDNGLLQVWRNEVASRFAELDEDGAAALGSGATSTSSSDPDGPTSHISENGLEVDQSADMSTTVPRLRRDDML